MNREESDAADPMKLAVGEALAQEVKDGDIIGVGTGTTVDVALTCIGERVRMESLRIAIVPTSLESAWRCEELGFTVLDSNTQETVEWSFDGADEVSPEGWLIKGRGAALLREKILAAKSKRYIIIVGENKLVKKLGKNHPIPVEAIPEASGFVQTEMTKLGANQVEMRAGQAKHGPVITEAGNVLLDCWFENVENGLETRIKSTVGVVESGLFMGFEPEVLVGKDSKTYWYEIE